jgi:hypothetical protein
MADAEIEARDLPAITHIEWRTAPVAGKDPIFYTLATHFTVLDADTLAPNWGRRYEEFGQAYQWTVQSSASVNACRYISGGRM